MKKKTGLPWVLPVQLYNGDNHMSQTFLLARPGERFSVAARTC